MLLQQLELFNTANLQQDSVSSIYSSSDAGRSGPSSIPHFISTSGGGRSNSPGSSSEERSSFHIANSSNHRRESESGDVVAHYPSLAILSRHAFSLGGSDEDRSSDDEQLSTYNKSSPSVKEHTSGGLVLGRMSGMFSFSDTSSQNNHSGGMVTEDSTAGNEAGDEGVGSVPKKRPQSKDKASRKIQKTHKHFRRATRIDNVK